MKSSAFRSQGWQILCSTGVQALRGQAMTWQELPLCLYRDFECRARSLASSFIHDLCLLGFFNLPHCIAANR